MKFDMPVKKRINLNKYPKYEVDLAREFAKKLYKEMGALVKGVIIFGSTAKKINQLTDKNKHLGDIDLLVIVDDLSVLLTPELVEAYRLIVQKIIADVSDKLHVITLKFTSFWEYVRVGDPIAMNILRDGVSLIDAGFFDPLQMLLFRGRIRPTQESIWTYYNRAPRTLLNSKWHILQATVDLYWAVIDAAHAALMKINIIPPSPDHVPELLDEKLVKTKLLEKKYVKTVKKFYDLMKMITHRQIQEISGDEFEIYYKEAESFVKRLADFVEFKK